MFQIITSHWKPTPVNYAQHLFKCIGWGWVKIGNGFQGRISDHLYWLYFHYQQSKTLGLKWNSIDPAHSLLLSTRTSPTEPWEPWPWALVKWLSQVPLEAGLSFCSFLLSGCGLSPLLWCSCTQMSGCPLSSALGWSWAEAGQLRLLSPWRPQGREGGGQRLSWWISQVRLDGSVSGRAEGAITDGGRRGSRKMDLVVCRDNWWGGGQKEML